MSKSRGKKRIGLALGGGAVRGLAHLGVLKVLLRAGIPIDCVSGTSVGSLIGAAYCAGMALERMEEIAAQIGWRQVASLTWPAQGFVTFAKMERWLVALLGDLVFADLATPLAIVATDLDNGQPVILREGRLAPAVRASCSIPGIVAPVKMNGRLLGDGVVVDNVPVAAARDLADYVIGVDICRPEYQRRLGPLGIGFAALETLARHAGEGVRAADCLISPDLALGARAAEEKLPLIHAALDAH
jgi:NTE family protein